VATKNFLMVEKRRGRSVVATKDGLFDRFLESKERVDAPGCLRDVPRRLEAVGVIRQLSFCDYVLLQPEILDDYCGWLALAARSEPDGLGFIKEDDRPARSVPMDAGRRLEGKPEERDHPLGDGPGAGRPQDRVPGGDGRGADALLPLGVEHRAAELSRRLLP
jgi:hypothetical protein